MASRRWRIATRSSSSMPTASCRRVTAPTDGACDCTDRKSSMRSNAPLIASTTGAVLVTPAPRRADDGASRLHELRLPVAPTLAGGEGRELGEFELVLQARALDAGRGDDAA